MRVAAWVMAVAVHLSTVAAGFVGALAKPELPALPHGDIIEVVPIDALNPLSLTQGATEPEVAAAFGISGLSDGVALDEKCVRYKYSSRMAYVVHFRAGRAVGMWLTEYGFVPYLCEGRLWRTMTIPARRWYPDGPVVSKHDCGCGPFDIHTCSLE